jgi:hypothetical protein
MHITSFIEVMGNLKLNWQRRVCMSKQDPSTMNLCRRLETVPPSSAFLSAAMPQVDEAAAVMTQLPPERAAALEVALASGDALPAFYVQALDAWGNVTGPADHLSAHVAVACDALSPQRNSFPVTASGTAFVEGAW